MTTLYTIGYEGRTFWEFAHILERAGIECVLDVRDFAESKRRDFHCERLPLLLDMRGIRYHRLPGLGNPYAGRKAVRKHGDFSIFISRLETDAVSIAELDIVRRTANEFRSALMCYCRKRAGCHAGIIACRSGLNIANLGES